MPTPPVQTPVEDDNPWKHLKPRDIFTDPEFYKLDKDARRIVASRVSKDFASASPADQDATLDAPQTYWEEYFKPEPVKEPGFIDKVTGAAKKLYEGFEHYQGEAAKQAAISALPKVKPEEYKALPTEFGTPPSLDELQKQAQTARRPKPKFDSEGSGYDYESAKAAGLGPDESGHWPSRDPRTGLLLKGRSHPTWSKTVEGENSQGYGIYRENGRYYSRPSSGSGPGASVQVDKNVIVDSTPVKQQERPGEKGKAEYNPFSKITGISAHKSAPMGLWDLAKEMVSPEGIKRVPFIGSVIEGMELYDVYRAAKRIDEGKGTPYDETILDEWEGKEVERQARGETFAYKVGNLISYLPGFASEFMVTGGAFKGGKEVAEQVITRALGKLAKNKVGQIAAKTVGAAVGSAAQTALMPHRIAESALQRMVPKITVEKNAKGEIENIVKDKGDEFEVALARALPDMYIEVASERTGGLIPGLASMASKLPYASRIKALKTAMMSQWFKLNPTKDWGDLLSKLRSGTGWNGVIGEIFEERVGEIARDLVGVNKPEEWSALTRMATGISPIPDGSPASKIRSDALRELGQQLMVEGVAFSAPGIVGNALDYIPKPGASQRAQAEFAKVIEKIEAMGSGGEEVEMPASFSQMQDQFKAELEASGYSKEEVRLRLALWKAQQKQAMRRSAQQMEADLTEEAPGEPVPVTVSGEPAGNPLVQEATIGQLIELNHQIRELSQGKRQAVIIPPGFDPVDRKAAISEAGPRSRVFWTMQGPIIYDPKKTNPETIQQMLLDGRQDELTARTDLPAAPVTPAPESIPEAAPQPEGAVMPAAPEAAPAPAAPLAPPEELPIGQSEAERRTNTRSDKPDRRQNWVRRKQVSQMTREEIEKELLTDELTGLRSRSAWERAPFKKYVASLDLDKMKMMNDVHGQEIGDDYLVHAARGFLASGIPVYRLGGDDFVVKADSKEEIDAAMAKARSWFDENPFIVGDKQYNVGFAYGIEESPEKAFKTMKENKAAAVARGELQPRYEPGKLPEEMGAPPFVPEAIPEAPPVPAGKNPFNWNADLGFEANGARTTVVGEYVWTPLGIGQVMEEEPDNPLPEGVITVGFGNRSRKTEEYAGGNYDFNVRDTVLLNQEDPKFDEDDYLLPDAPKRLKIDPDSRFTGMNPRQVYLALRERQANKLFALKRAGYAAEIDQLPGWRASNLHYLTQEYENGYSEIAKVFGAKTAQSMADELEIPMNRALGIKQPPHVTEGRLYNNLEYVGPQNAPDGSVAGFLYNHKKLMEEGAPQEMYQFMVDAGEDLEEAMRGRAELWEEEKENRKAAEDNLKKIQRTESAYELQKSEIEERFKKIRELEGVLSDPSVVHRIEAENLLATQRRLYEGMWAQAADEISPEFAAEERRKLEAKYPPATPGENPIPTPTEAKARISGPLHQFFESVATIDPRIFTALNNGLNKAEEAGVADDIILGFIAGKTKDAIIKDITSQYSNRIPSALILRVWVSAIKQLKGIPDATSPQFSAWQNNAQEILKVWSRTPQVEELPPEMPPAPGPINPIEDPKIAQAKKLGAEGEIWRVMKDAAKSAFQGDVWQAAIKEARPLFVAYREKYGAEEYAKLQESIRRQYPVIIEPVFPENAEAEKAPPAETTEKTTEPPLILPKDINERPTEDDGSSRYGFGVKVIKGSLQLLLSPSQRQALFTMEFDRAESILLQRIYKANDKDPRIAKELTATLKALKEDHAAKLAQNKPAEPIPESPAAEPKPPVTVNEPATVPGTEAVDIKATDALNKFRERFKKKVGTRAGLEMALPIEGAAPTREELLNDPEMLEILAGIGNEYHSQGVTDRSQWHASLYAELESMAEGIGTDLEPLFPMIWEAITGEEDFIGGLGGVYGVKTQEGNAGSEPAGVPANGGETGGSYGGVQPAPVEGFGGLGPAPGVPAGAGVPGEAGISGEPEGGPEPATSGGSGGPATVSGSGANPRESGRFFEYTPDVEFGKGGWAGKLEQNMEAVRLVKELQQEGRLPNEDEKVILARFIGWGALWRVFDPKNYQYSNQRSELRHLLTEEEFKRAAASTRHAFFTAEPISRAMWKIVDRLGFKGQGAVLEGASGVGTILGTAPDHIANTSQFFGTELDPITAAIAGYLYPAAKIFPRGFQELEFPDGTVDLAISNVPFSGKIFDKRYDSLDPEIHDYFFLKTVDKLRPGGILVYITSLGTMDKNADHIRRMLADKADLVTAFRMPNGAFMSNAGTGVATDIIILQKRAPGQISNGENWSKSERIEVPDEVNGGTVSINVNEYYQRHPENVFGHMARGHGLRSSLDSIVVPPAGMKQNEDLTGWVSDQIDQNLNRIPPDIYQPSAESSPRQTVQFLERFADSSVWEKQIIVDEKGNLMRKVNGFLQPLEEELAVIPNAVDMIKDLIGVRESLWDVFRTQLSTNDDEALRIAQDRLNTVYDSFLDKWRGSGSKGAKFMYMNDRKVKAAFGADPTYYFLVSLEEVNQDDGTITKSPIFTERSMRPSMPLESLPDDPRQAMLMVYANRGFLDLELMGHLTGKTAGEWENRLRDENLIFKNPVTGVLELAEDYLSGDVYDKIEAAEKGLPLDPSLQNNIDALTEVIPERVLIDNPDDPKQVFEARLGASWVSDTVYEDFIRTLFDNPELEIEIGRSKAGGYTVKIKGNLSDYIRYKKWGTDRKPAEQLIALAMNQKKPVVYDEVDDRLVRNPIKTKEAQLVQTKVREEFVRWARTGPYSKDLEEGYNRAFNRVRLRQYDGSHLTFEGMNRSILRHGELEPHQRNAVWRIILDGRALLAHFVGSGKTFEMAAAAMEMRRMGLVNKNMISVPKNIYRQFGADFARLYPGAKLLVVDAKDFEAKNRKKLFAQIAMQDWDAVIISHEQLAKIPMSPERTARMINEEIDELEEQIREMGRPANKAQVTTLKQLQKRLDDYRAQLQHLLNLRQDDTVYFDQMGVDMLMIDEAHAYKNLPILTSMGQIAGLGGTSAKRSLTLKVKTDYLLEKNNGRGVVFATGTPVSNSMVELYNFNKFLDPAGLRNAGVKRFDAWAANFGEVKLIVGIGPDGRSLRPQTVFGEFTNLTELQQMFRKYADVITRDMINLPIPAQINAKGEPDKPTVVKITPDAATDEYFEEIKRRLKFLDENPSHDKRLDNILVIMNDARLASLDMRLVDGNAPDNPDGKANTAVRMMAQYYFEHQEDRRTQVAFTGNFRNSKTGFNLYDDMKKKLIDAGVPESRIAVIHDYKTDDDVKNLYKQMREGQIRILLTTKKSAEGANMQTRLGMLYHLDAPWTPKEIEQREGRIIRQGNLHYQWEEPVQVIQFVTERTLDSRLFEILRRKARFIRQYLKGDSNVRKASDPAAKVVVTYEMISAEASGNPEYLVKVQLEQQVADLEIMRERYLDNQRTLENDLNLENNRQAQAKKNIAYYESAIADFEKQREPFSYNIDGQEFADPDAAVESVRKKKETGVPNPKIAEGKELEPGEPETVPYRPFASGKYMTPEEVITKINYKADPANRNFKFNAVIAGKKYEKEMDAEAAMVDAVAGYKDVLGDSTIDFEVYGFPAKLTLHLSERKIKGEKGKEETVQSRWVGVKFLQESKSLDAAPAAIKSIVHSLHDMKRRLATELTHLEVIGTEISRIQEAMGKPWEQQEEYEEARTDLREVNTRLGLADPDEEGSVSTEESGEATDIDEGGDENPEPEEGDEDEFSSETGDHFFDMVTPYREIGVPGSGNVIQTKTAEEENAEDMEAREPKKIVKELPEIPKEAEFGPEFLYTQALDQATIDALNKGLVPQDLIDNLKNKANRRLAKIQRVSAMANDAGWEISDGITLLQLYKTEQDDVTSLQAWDALSYGRIQIPELLWLVKEVTGKHMGLNKRLRTALGHFVPNDSGGLIEVRPDLAYELKDREQLTRTIAHEIGHAIDFAPDSDIAKGNLIGRLLSLHKFLKQTYDLNGTALREKTLRAELTALSDYWRPWDQANAPKWFRDYRASAPELYADFLSAILNSPGTAARLAPTAYKVWHQELDRKPEVKEAYVKLRLMMEGTEEQLLDFRMNQMAAMFKASEATEMQMIEGENTRSYSWWGGVRYQFDDMRWEIKQRERKAIRSGVYSPTEDSSPTWLWDEMPCKLRTQFYRYQQRVRDLVVKPLEAAKMSFRELNEYMFLHRAATERQNILNPVVGLGEYAYKSLEHMKKVLGEERFTLVEKAARMYADIRWDLVEAAQAAGIYSKEIVEKVFLPNKYSYAKFTPIEYVKDWVSAHAQKQSGFTGNIAGPFTETLKMDQSLIFLTARNNAVKATLKFLEDYYPDEIHKAKIKTHNPNGPNQYYAPPNGFDLVEVMENGKNVGYYVDKYIAESCNEVSPERTDRLTWLLQLYHRKYFWPTVILYNLGFSGWGNPIRDIASNFKKLPLKGVFIGDAIQLVANYAAAAPHALKWLWKNKNADLLVNEMIDSYSYSMPTSEIILDEADPYTNLIKRAGIIKADGQIDRDKAGRYIYNSTRIIGTPLRFMQNFTEITGKLAGYQIRKDAGEAGKELAFNVRNFTSTPNYDVKGLKTATTNSLFVFSNIMKEGWKSEYLIATDPKTRGGYWLRTSKLLVLRILAVFAEMGLLKAFFGDDLEKSYKSATRYMKDNFFLVPISIPDAEGRVSFIQLPCDEVTRVLGTIIRHSLIAMKGNDPGNFESFYKQFMANVLPSLTPALTTVAGWHSFLAGVPYIDGLRGTPAVSDTVRKAGGWEPWKRMFLWTLNENGLGQYSTFDDSTQTSYQIWTQMDPLVGRLIGRMVKSTNYGLVEMKNTQLAEIAGEKAGSKLAKWGASKIVGNFYSHMRNVNKDHTLSQYYAAKGQSVERLTEEYPDSIWAPLYNKCAAAMNFLQKKIEAIEGDPKLSDKEKELQKILIRQQMDEIAKKALLKSGKIQEEKKPEELPSEFTNPPEIR
jgi:N12 class adenine-specific DNA methylase/GGDEF domain-containing protein